MTIINTTFVLERSLYESFVAWLENVYISAAVSTGLFKQPRIVQVLTDSEPESVSIACELLCDSLSEADRWYNNSAILLHQNMHSLWGERVLFFTTYLKVVYNG